MLEYGHIFSWLTNWQLISKTVDSQLISKSILYSYKKTTHRNINNTPNFYPNPSRICLPSKNRRRQKCRKA